MKKEKELLKNTVVITIGKICTQLITFFLLPLYTSVLSTSEYGTVDFVVTLTTLFLPIITFQIEQAVFRELIDDRATNKNKKAIFSNGLFFVTIQSLIFFVIFMLFSPLIKNEYKYLLLLNIFSFNYLSYFQQVLRGEGNNLGFSLSSFICAFFTVIFNLVFILVFKMGATGMLIGTIMGQIVATAFIIIYDKMYALVSFNEFSTNKIKEMLKYSIPLIPNQLSWWVFNVSDRVLVTIILGVSFNGILSASSKFSNVFITLFNIFSLSWTESISLHYKEKDIEQFFNKMFEIVLNIFNSIGILIIAVMPFVFNIFIKQDFQSGYNLIPILIVASLFNVVIGLFSALYIANKNTKEVARTSIVAAVINIVTHLLLIKYINLYAAAISTFLSFFIMAVYRYFDVNKKYLKIKINKKSIVFTIIILFFVVYSYYLKNYKVNVLSLGIAIIYSFLINKKYIKNIFILVKNKIKGSKNVKREN